MQPTFIVSSNIEAAAYQYGSMFIRFKSGVSYRYDKVPHAVFIGLCEPFTSMKEAA